MKILKIKKPQKIPEGTEILILDYNFNYPMTKLPSTLKYIEFGPNYSHPLPKFPNGLETLAIYGEYDGDFNELPMIKTLILGSYCKPLDFLPTSLKCLIFYFYTYNLPLNNIPPQTKIYGTNELGNWKYSHPNLEILSMDGLEEFKEMHLIKYFN